MLEKDIQNSELQKLFPPVADESRLLIGCRRADYSASQIARAVEDCNAHVLNLDVTSITVDDVDLVISLRVDHRNADAIVRSLGRYGYEVLSASSSAADVDERMRNRVNELLRYLEL